MLIIVHMGNLMVVGKQDVMPGPSDNLLQWNEFVRMVQCKYYPETKLYSVNILLRKEFNLSMRETKFILLSEFDYVERFNIEYIY